MGGKKGFSLVELLIAVAIGSGLITVTIAVLLSSYENVMFSSSRGVLTRDNLLLSNYFRTQLQGIGGGSVVSWMGIWLENTCAARGDLPPCGGGAQPNVADRVTTITAFSPITECQIADSSGFPGSVGISNNPTCCIDNSWNNQPIMLVQGTKYFTSQYVTAVDTVNCVLTLSPGQASGNDFPNPATAIPAPGWQGLVVSPGVAAKVSVATYFMTFAAGGSGGGATWGANNLLLWKDTNNDGNIQPNELSVIADNIYEFQAAYGVDANGNSIITDTGNNTDQWLYNSPGESWITGVFITLPLLPKAQYIREVEIGILSGGPGNFSNSPPSAFPPVFDSVSVTVPNVDLRQIIIKATPRNNFIFE